MKTADFDYDLPEEYIAQFPPKERGDARLMVLEREKESIKHRKYNDIVEYVRPGDVIVFNETKVLQARIFAKVERTGREVEVLFLNNMQGAKVGPELKDSLKGSEFWYCLVGRARHVKIGDSLWVGDHELKIVDREEGKAGFVIAADDSEDLMKKYGHVPLPPYIKRKDTEADKDRYNPIFARRKGAVASPTASLNVTRALQSRLKKAGAKLCYVNLVVSWGTFAPINTENIEDFKIHEEYIDVPEDVVSAVNNCEGRVWAWGTTALRALETAAVGNGKIEEYHDYTDLYVFPGYEFKIAEVLVTNFHAPRSSLITLVAAFAGKDFVLRAYEEAKKQEYRFLSYGDSMIIV